ncbi:MAG: CRISPR-associated endonuclease Cas2 [Candidatus Daviesbacteria bacterium]|nr:CRISPR-associated endonuclease Cas2 [Candidatus Daviesbacteria bacterium]
MNDKKILTREVLKVIAVSGILIGSAFIPTLPMAARAVVKAWKGINKKDLGRIIKRLEKQEMITMEEKTDGKMSIIITDKGKKRLLEYDFEDIQLKTHYRDGKWRLVIFDIPEDKRNARDVFRRKLLQLGFIRLQDSVFAGAYPCKSEIDFLCHFLEISDFVTLVSVNKIERGEQLIFKKYHDYGDN